MVRKMLTLVKRCFGQMLNLLYILKFEMLVNMKKMSHFYT